MLRIRFTRVGKKNSPSFRLVVTPQRTASQTGRFLEILGSYDPRAHSRSFKNERILYWISQGARPSDSVKNMLIAEGVIKGVKVAVHNVPKKKEESAETPKEKEVKVGVTVLGAGAVETVGEDKTVSAVENTQVPEEAESGGGSTS